jgi:hypothetical protein
MLQWMEALGPSKKKLELGSYISRHHLSRRRNNFLRCTVTMRCIATLQVIIEKTDLDHQRWEKRHTTVSLNPWPAQIPAPCHSHPDIIVLYPEKV